MSPDPRTLGGKAVIAPPNTSRERGGAERQRLLETGAAMAREHGWLGFGLGDLARRAGCDPASVRLHFSDLGSLGVAVADEFANAVCASSARAIGRHPDDSTAALAEALDRFFVDQRVLRQAYLDLLACRLRHPVLCLGLDHSCERKRRRLVELWARSYERAERLGRRDALGLASFQYESIRGLAAQIDRGELQAETGVPRFLDVMEAAAARLGGRPPALRAHATASAAARSTPPSA